MNKYNKNLSLILFLTILLSLTFISCSDDKNTTEPEAEGNVIDPNLVGTWKLTKILAPIQTTPEAVGIDLTAVFNADGTLEFTTTDAEGTTVDGGTWSTSNGNLTFTIDGDEPITSPYTVNGNIASITSFTIVFNDSPITASLEFTKQ